MKRNQFLVEELRMPFDQKVHPQDDTLELYALGRLQEPELGQLEEHLLVCGGCQDRLDETAEFVSAMREAAANVAAEPAEEKAERRKWFHFDWLPGGMPTLAMAMMALVAVFVWQPWRAAGPAEWRTVELETLRGAGSTEAAAVEGFALDLRLDATGLTLPTPRRRL